MTIIIISTNDAEMQQLRISAQKMRSFAQEHGGTTVWCTINRFKLPSSTYAADRSKAAPSICVPQMYVLLFHTVLVTLLFVSLVVVSSTDFISWWKVFGSTMRQSTSQLLFGLFYSAYTN
ncbi:uncharacterized protein LOC132719604 [Ruditapes philippinarum]|uniref:uncharacterized protein LOC132719604 n=1 Tax=Ruditapes philippinarum TaxID=129788 RepID=UPI00295B94E8|nr:uncharacterized protein LOC132719604 [Ruditapes philippinarum]